MAGMFKRTVAKYKKNRRATAQSTPSKPFYTVPTIQGLGYGFTSGFTPGTQMSVDFDMQVIITTGVNVPLPEWVDASDVPGNQCVAIVQISPTSALLTFASVVKPGDVINISDRDPAIRTMLGGFVAPGAYVVP